jgi:hypothetical protein
VTAALDPALARLKARLEPPAAPDAGVQGPEGAPK